LAYLPSVSPSSSRSETTPIYYVYGYQGSNVTAAKSTENYKTYGVLYNWQAAKTACPPGWRLPTDQEWKNLEVLLGMDLSESDKDYFRNSGAVGKLMKSTSAWEMNGNGTNDSHFNALPGGYSDYYFSELGYSASFWSSSETNTGLAWSREFRFNNDGVSRNDWPGGLGFSVRCLCNW
ncbi:MAG: fibrobacter succinogenes major paralogous domain-containing protein, partial [Deltaproteobacteria bacterium]|nr:fibrobacter succinogenes major paralogous domain-containing protein [Deltaproteobacteria bacterium]